MVTAVTRPVEETVATAVFVELQVTVRFVRVPPRASRGVAVSCTVPPTMTDDDGGETSTDATGGGGSVPLLQAATTVRHAARVTRSTPRSDACRAFFRGRVDVRVHTWTRGATFMELP
jgi:hypothetical protein